MDGGRKGIDCWGYLDEAVLAGHALGGESEADSDGGQETFGDVGDDDADEEDDGVQPLVSEQEGDDEESDAEEDGHAGDQVDEVGDLAGDGRLARLKSRSQSCDASHHRVVADADDYSAGGTCVDPGQQQCDPLVQTLGSCHHPHCPKIPTFKDSHHTKIHVI